MDNQHWGEMPAIHIASGFKTLRESRMNTELKMINEVSLRELQGSIEELNKTHIETKLNNDSTPFVCRGKAFDRQYLVRAKVSEEPRERQLNNVLPRTEEGSYAVKAV